MERSFTTWPGVWSKILRNLDFIASYGGMLELNSAALRKGMTEPYPKAEICKVRTQYFVLYLTTNLMVLGICGAQGPLLFV